MATNRLFQKVNGGKRNVIFAPILKLNKGKIAVLVWFNMKQDHILAAVVDEFLGVVGVHGFNLVNFEWEARQISEFERIERRLFQPSR